MCQLVKNGIDESFNIELTQKKITASESKIVSYHNKIFGVV